MGETFGHAMRLVLFLTLPAMVGLIVLREPIVALLFQRGAFDPQTTRLTSDALLYYALGLWAFSAVRIVVSTFYAMQDTRTPVIGATLAIATNILLGMALMGPMGHCGLALATALSSMVNLTILVYELRRKLGVIRWRAIFSCCLKTMLASGAMAVVVIMIRRQFLFNGPAVGGTRLLLDVGLAIGSGIAVFCGMAVMLRIPEWQKMAGLVKRSIKRS
jgi:putative peptidoglycan lipid II flippase